MNAWEQNGAKVEQTKIRECAERSELKRTSKCVMVGAADNGWLGMRLVFV